MFIGGRGLLRRQQECLNRALEIQPDDPEVNYSLGMFYAQQNQMQRAADYLQKAIELRPDYPEALNNLGVLFVRRAGLCEGGGAVQDLHPPCSGLRSVLSQSRAPLRDAERQRKSQRSFAGLAARAAAESRSQARSGSATMTAFFGPPRGVAMCSRFSSRRWVELAGDRFAPIEKRSILLLLFSFIFIANASSSSLWSTETFLDRK